MSAAIREVFAVVRGTSGVRCSIRRFCSYLPLALTGIGVLVLSGAAVGEGPEPTVLVRRVVPANFHDPDFDQSKLLKLLTNSPNRAVLAKKDSTISGILKEQFNVSQSWTPAVYEKFQAHVLALNKLRDPTRELKAGQTLKLPDLPRTAQVYLKPGQEIFTQSKSSFLTKWDPELRASTESPKVGTNAPGTAATEVQIRLMPVSILGAFLAYAGLTALLYGSLF